MKFPIAIPAALAALVWCTSTVSAEDVVERPAAPVVVAKDRVLVFGDGVARFHVERDIPGRRMTFRLADPTLRIDSAPVVLVTTAEGPREVALVPVTGQPGVWVWADDAVKADRFDGRCA